MELPFGILVPEVGIEPTRGEPRWILSPVRLPVSPLRHRGAYTIDGALQSREISCNRKGKLIRLSRTEVLEFFIPAMALPGCKQPGITSPEVAGSIPCRSYTPDNISKHDRHTAPSPVSAEYPGSFLPTLVRHYRRPGPV